LQRTEAALAAESAARDKAERSLAETHSVVRDLQTKIGHAELAKNEAIEALHREREALAELRAENEGWEERLQDVREQALAAERNANLYHEQLADERQARKIAEKALRVAEAARDAAEELVRTLSEEPPAPRRTIGSSRRSRATIEPEIVAVAARRGRQPEAASMEPEPVKWWLNTKSAGKKR
jgi:chromosome segregation ATPase